MSNAKQGITVKELGITKTYDLAKPTEVIQMASVLKSYIVKQQLYTAIKGKNYSHVDGWQFAGFLTGINAMPEEPKDISKGTEIRWSCSAKLFNNKGEVVGYGFALCSSKEANKKGFDEYAIASMAQTRAIGKAYRNKIGWIMKLAGYQSTPSEEMHKVSETPKAPPEPYAQEPIIQQQEEVIEDHVCVWRGCGKDLTKAEANYSQKMFKRELCREHQNAAKQK